MRSSFATLIVLSESARCADDALSRGEVAGPLHGVPMTIKESYNIEGLHTCWGLPAFENNVAKRDADAVRKFKAAGAHFIGKTNVPTMLDDFQTYNPNLRNDKQSMG